VVSATFEPESPPSTSVAGTQAVSGSIASAAIASRTGAFFSAVMVKVALWATQVSTTLFEKPAESIRIQSS